MPKVPIITARKLIKVLKKAGFVLDHSQGSHYIFYHPKKKIAVPVPVHAGKDLGKGLVMAILKESKITIDEFLRLL
jgi:predicted RNA binding protein YcfA (HicA-like mRNA interferase family)